MENSPPSPWDTFEHSGLMDNFDREHADLPAGVDPDDLALWLVVPFEFDDSVFDSSNAFAFQLLMRRDVHSRACVVLNDDDGRSVVLVNQHIEEALDYAERLETRIASGGHLDLALYDEARLNAVQERWDNLEISERIDILQESSRHEDDLLLALEDSCPEEIVQVIEHIFQL